VLPDQS